MIIKRIKTWWPTGPKPGNMGDIITRTIFKRLFNVKASWTHFKNTNQPVVLATGSILSKVNNKSIVWGSGTMRSTDRYPADATYLAVRGPISYEMVKSFGAKINPIWGDPGLLVSKFYNPDIKKKYEIGIVPHYVDYEKVKKWYNNNPNINVINVLNDNPLKPINEILKCKNIISSSLHGIIFAHSYNIPACWAKISDNLKGDGTKFIDYYKSVNLIPSLVDFTDKISENDLPKLSFQNEININVDPLIKVFNDFVSKR